MHGDDQPTWRGTGYRRQNLSIIAHLPTKSEFFISVRTPPETNGDITNNLQLIIREIKEKAGASASKETWETITQKTSDRKKSSGMSFDYLRSEFTGLRADTDRYSKSDQVTTVIYVACLTPQRPASRTLYSVAAAMIPADVPKQERERLLGILSGFLRERITYFL